MAKEQGGFLDDKSVLFLRITVCDKMATCL